MADLRRFHTEAFAAAAAVVAALWLALGAAPLPGGAVLALAGLVLILGLPHGALDLWIARRSGLWGQQGGFVRFHAAYLVLAGAVAAAFVLAPALSLAAFLALSLWHFADDWRALPLPVRLSGASVIVAVPTLFHTSAVAGIFRIVTGGDVAMPAALPPSAIAALALLVAGAVGAAFTCDRKAGIELCAIAGLGALLPPLVFFAAYFTLLHGPRHMMRHGALIAGRRARLVLVLYTLAALGIVAALGFVLAQGGEPSPSEGAIRALFVGLAALTVPHALLIEYDKQAAPQGTAPAGPGHMTARRAWPGRPAWLTPRHDR